MNNPSKKAASFVGRLILSFFIGGFLHIYLAVPETYAIGIAIVFCFFPKIIYFIFGFAGKTGKAIGGFFTSILK